MAGGPDGITLGITTVTGLAGFRVGTVHYTTDDMTGGNYELSSYIKYVVNKIKDNF